jgi:hypothetical protein
MSSTLKSKRPLTGALLFVALVVLIIMVFVVLFPSSPERDDSVESSTLSDEVKEEAKEQETIELATEANDNSTANPFEETADEQLLTVHLHGSRILNTGVWSEYASRDPFVSRLRWAAEKLPVYKSCDRKCIFTRKGNVSDRNVDAAMVELVNAEKFGNGYVLDNVADPTHGLLPEYDENSQSALRVMFYFEPISSYPRATQKDVVRKEFDLIVEPMRPDSDDELVNYRGNKIVSLPVTMTCAWQTEFVGDAGEEKSVESYIGLGLDSYFTIPLVSYEDKALLIYHNDHGHDPKYRDFFREFEQLSREYGGDAQEGIGAAGTELPVVDFSKKHKQLKDVRARVAHLSGYKFVLITENKIQKGWVEMEFSQAFAAGAVPVYLGAPDAVDYAVDGEGSYIDVIKEGWASEPESLLAFLKDMTQEKYEQYLVWKKKRPEELSSTFIEKSRQCVYEAECRICEALHDLGQ